MGRSLHHRRPSGEKIVQTEQRNGQNPATARGARWQRQWSECAGMHEDKDWAQHSEAQPGGSYRSPDERWLKLVQGAGLSPQPICKICRIIRMIPAKGTECLASHRLLAGCGRVTITAAMLWMLEETSCRLLMSSLRCYIIFPHSCDLKFSSWMWSRMQMIS